MNKTVKVVLSMITAILVLGTVVQAQTNVAAPSSVVIPAITPVATGTINTTLNLLTGAPASVGATVVADGVSWILKHGAVSTGPGLTLQGKFGAVVGQDVKVYSVGVVGTDEFDIVVSHADYSASSGNGGMVDMFGLGINKTIPAPKFLSNFVIITTRPSTFKLGVSLYMPTTAISHGTFNKDNLVICPHIGWTF